MYRFGAPAIDPALLAAPARLKAEYDQRIAEVQAALDAANARYAVLQQAYQALQNTKPTGGGGGLGGDIATAPPVTSTVKNPDGSKTTTTTTMRSDGSTSTVKETAPAPDTTAKSVGAILLLTSPAWGAALYAMAGGFR